MHHTSTAATRGRANTPIKPSKPIISFLWRWWGEQADHVFFVAMVGRSGVGTAGCDGVTMRAGTLLK